MIAYIIPLYSRFCDDNKKNWLCDLLEDQTVVSIFCMLNMIGLLGDMLVLIIHMMSEN